MPMLVGLIQKSSPAISSAACGSLGSFKVAEGTIDQGFALLKKAVEDTPNATWPGRAEAEGDLGLTYLILGNETQGLACLHRAQERFEKQSQWEDWAQCLLNEAAYLEKIGQALKAQEIRDRIASIQ